jgi:hypothetical protein
MLEPTEEEKDEILKRIKNFEQEELRRKNDRGSNTQGNTKAS